MFWLPLAGAGVGFLQGAKNRDRMREQDKFRKEALRWSPWTGMEDPGRMEADSPFASAFKFGTGGALLGQMFGAGGAPGGSPGASPSPMGTPTTGDTPMPVDTGVVHGPQPPPASTMNTYGNQGPWGQMASAGSAGAMGANPQMKAMMQWQMLRQMGMDPFQGMA